MNRRGFLANAGSMAAGVLLGGPAGRAAAAQGLGSPGAWHDLRGQFQLPPDLFYFNTAGLGASPRVVTDLVKAMMDREEQAPAPGHSEEDWGRIRGICAALLGPSCGADEIALVSGATEGINAILNGLRLGRGDEVVTSTHEHPALVIPLLHKMKTAGIGVRTFEPDLKSPAGTMERLEELLTPRTRLIFVSHVTCTTGQVYPVAAIGRLAAERRVWFALDGAQSLAQFPIDIAAIGAHFYTASAHKFMMAPKRTGLLYVRRDHLETLVPTVVGAYSDARTSLAERHLTLQPSAQRYEYGTQNDAQIYGLEAAGNFVAALGLANIWEHNRSLADVCLAGLRPIPGVELLSPPDASSRSAMVTFRLVGRDNREVANMITRRRHRVRSVTEGGLDAVRASFHVCNTEDQVRELVHAVEDIADGEY